MTGRWNNLIKYDEKGNKVSKKLADGGFVDMPQPVSHENSAKFSNRDFTQIINSTIHNIVEGYITSSSVDRLNTEQIIGGLDNAMNLINTNISNITSNSTRGGNVYNNNTTVNNYDPNHMYKVAEGLCT